MKILQNQNNGYNYNCKSKQQVNKSNSPSFGVNLKVLDQDVVKFAYMQSANKALKNNIANPDYIDRNVNNFMSNINTMAEVARNIEPKELPVILGLTPEAKNYANSMKVNGEMFEGVQGTLSTCIISKQGVDEIGNYVKDIMPQEDAVAGALQMRDMFGKITNLAQAFLSELHK